VKYPELRTSPQYIPLFDMRKSGDTWERRYLELRLPSRSNKSYPCNNGPSRPSSTT